MDAHNNRSDRNPLERNRRPITENAGIFEKKVGTNDNARPYFGERFNNCGKAEQSTKNRFQFRKPEPDLEKKCFNCGKGGHLARNCFRTEGTAAMNSGPRYNERQPDSSFNSGTKSGLNPNVTAQKEVINEKPSEIVTCRAHNRDRCGLCFNCPVQKSNALSTELESKCGCFVPVIADACRSRRERMPVCEGKMGDQTISVLRDTGCPKVVVKRSLLTDIRLAYRKL